MPAIAIYARVSTDEQRKAATIDSQRQSGESYCLSQGYADTAWYVDDGVSGTIPLEKRPEGRRLLDDAVAGKIDIVLVYRIDRLARTILGALQAVRDLENAGARVKSITEPFDTSTAMGRAMLAMLASFAEMEHEAITERTRTGKHNKARQSKWWGGRFPIGYTTDDEKNIIVDESPALDTPYSPADIARMIYQYCTEERLSTHEIACRLNELHVPTEHMFMGRTLLGKPTSGKWSNSTIVRTLHSTWYIGQHLYRSNSGDDIVVAVPSLISTEQWERAQGILRANYTKARRNTKRDYLLRGLVKCGLCGASYIGDAGQGHIRTGAQRVPYYRCLTRREHGVCVNGGFMVERLDTLIWDRCVHYLLHPGEAIMLVGAEDEDENGRRAREEIEAVKRELNEINVQKDKILALYRKNLLSADDVTAQLQQIRDEQITLQQRLRTASAAISPSATEAPDTAEVLGLMRELLQGGELEFAARRCIVETLVRRITARIIRQGRKFDASSVITIDFIWGSECVPLVGL